MSLELIRLPGNPDQSTDPELPQPGPGEDGDLTVQAYGLTDRGRVRPVNEDQFLIARLAKAMQIQQISLPQARTRYGDERGYLFLVADGMGGHQGGQHASALAVDTIEQFMLNTLKWFLQLKGPEGESVLTELQAALRQTDARLLREGSAHRELWGMGTTLTLAYSLRRELFVVHVGDSRCYLGRHGELYQLTRDHNLVQELVRRGHLRPEEASGHRYRHVITNVVGGTEPGVDTEVHKVHLEPGDVLLLCTDGLTELMPDEDVRVVLQAEPDPQRACERLVQEANERGGTYNVTVIVARYGTGGD
jgi:protein phosphatase